MSIQRLIFATARLYPRFVTIVPRVPKLKNLGSNSSIIGLQQRQFSIVTSSVQQHPLSTSLLQNPRIICIGNNLTKRSVTKYSWKKGKRKTVATVLKRFYRLNWGGWIRTKCGRHKRLWRKSPPRKRRLRQHVLCNATQCTLLDKMVNNYWRKPKYYVDDPYEPYHSREECRFTYTKPRPYFPPEN